MLNVNVRSQPGADNTGLPYHARGTRRVMFEDEPDLERARRVEIYARAAERLDMLHGVGERSAAEHAPKPVRCVDTGQEFGSIKGAARFVSARIGRKVRRSALRTAIKRSQRFYGLTFEHVSGGGAFPDQRRAA